MKVSRKIILKRFAADWWRSRDWSLMWFGLPALLAGIVLMVLIAFAEMRPARERATDYMVAARQAYARKDFGTADIFYKKSLAEESDSLEVLFEAAAVAHQQEETTRRDAILRRLIEEEYPAALLFRASNVLEGNPDMASITEAEELLARVLEERDGEQVQQGTLLARSADDVRRRLAAVFRARGEFEKSISYSESVIKPSYGDAIDLTTTYLLNGQRPEASETADKVLDRSNSGESVALVRAMAEAARGNGLAVIELLKEGRALATDRDGLIAWAQTSFRCFDLLSMSSDEVPLFALLEPSIRTFPDRPWAAGPLLHLSGLIEAPGRAALDDPAMTSILAGGDVPVSAHIVAGLRATKLGKGKEAEVHFQIAEGLSPRAGLILAQCGLYLARRRIEETVAISLGETAARLSQSQGLVVIFHGQILLSLQRWQEAVDWLTPHIAEESEADEESKAIDALLQLARTKLRGA